MHFVFCVGMTLLVTGGAGFIGSNLVDRLIEVGHKVVIMDDLSTGKKEFINKKATFYQVKVEHADAEEVFKTEHPVYVFHLAAQVDARKSVVNPLCDASANIFGTLNLLKLSRKYRVKKFIFASSGGVIYGDTDKPADEMSQPNPISPYGIAKLTAEQYIDFYAKEYSLRYSILRYANVYGPRQDPFGEAGVIAIFIGQMLQGKPCILYGFGNPIRDYVYVDDAVSATIKSMNKGNCSTFNIGTGIPTSVNQLFSIMSKITNYSLPPIYERKRRGEINKSVLNCNRAKEILGWIPKVTLEEGITKTVQSLKQSYQELRR